MAMDAIDLGRWVLFLSCILRTLSGYLTNAQPLFTAVYCYYPSRDTYANDSTFKKNLDALAPIVSSSIVSFHNLSIGQNPDRVNVIALCRGDVAWDICRSCLNDAYTKLRQICPNDKQPIGWYDYCMLRYSDGDIFNTMSTSPYANTSNQATVSNGISRQFNQAVTTLLSKLLGKASRCTSVQKFAAGQITIGSNNNRMTIYGLAECTPDLNKQQCRDCLTRTAEKLPECCDGRFGGRVLYPSCNFRYETSQFYNATPNHSCDGENNTTRNLIIIVISSIIIVLLVIACIWIIIMRKRKQKKRKQNKGETSMKISTDKSLRFDYDAIKVANKLRQDDFGDVYKGTLRGRDIAVKMLSQTSHQGDDEFKNEVVLMANLQHKNLVKLLGFCIKGKEKLLVYEVMPNASLDQFIFDSEKRRCLDWSVCYKIIRGIAQGLMYLHEGSTKPTIHGDLKASNILLDDGNPIIADFGITRMFDLKETHSSTSKTVETYGHIAPECFRLGQFSTKSDVFSFGVLVLEIVSGQKNSRNREECLQSRAWKNCQEGTPSEFIDPTLRDGSSPINEILECVQIGLLCVHEKEDDRPTMAAVVTLLNNLSLTIPNPTEPTFSS